MSASKVLDLAEQQGLLEAKVIADLRRQVAESKFVVTPEALAKVLVDHGHLTAFQARKLVASALGTTAEPAPPVTPQPPAATPAAARREMPDEFSLADDEGNPIAPPAPSAPPEEDIVDLEPVAPPPKPKPPSPPPKKQPAPKPAARPVPAPVARPKPTPPPAPVEEEVIDLEPVSSQAPTRSPAPPPPPRQPKLSRPAPPPPASAAEEELVPLTPIESAPPSAPAAAPSYPAAGPAVATAPEPIHDLFGDPLAAPTDPLASAEMLGETPQAKQPKKKKPGNVWDSPLLLLGGGGLGVMIIMFGLLFYSLTRGSAAELFAKAEADYQAGSYGSAIKGYETFLKKYPDNPDASLARVRRGMAGLRQVTDGGKNPRQGLKTAKELLPQIEVEDKFNEARIELSSILPDIADGFAEEASSAEGMAKKEELVQLANEAMELVNNPSYIPASLRKDREARIAGILDKLKVAERSIDQDKELAVAVGKIAAASEQGNAAAAYKVRADLLKVYPALEVNPDLVAAIQQVGERERQLVQVSEPATAALTEEAAPLGAPVVLAQRQGPAPSGGGEATPVFVLAEGSVYSLDLATGQIFWRRHVGYQTLANPLPLAGGDATDALVVDARNQELLRLKGASGSLVWRQPIGEAFAAPVISGERIYVTTRKGRVLEIDAATGEISRQAQLPQGALVPLSVEKAQAGQRPARLFQLGEHSTLFVLKGDTLEGLESYYLGHKAGAIFVPPVTVLDQVLVAESPGDNYTLLHVLSTDAKTKRLTAVGRPFRLRGRIVTPLGVSGRRVAAITDLGQIAVYEVDAANKEQPVRQIGGMEAGEKSALLAHCTLEGNRLWIGGKRCTLLEIQAALQQIGRKWTLHQDDSLIGPLQVSGQTLVHVRRRAGWPGLVVEGCGAADGQTLWTNQIAVPVVALEVSESRKAVDVLAGSGRLYSLSGEQLKGGVVESPTFSPPPGSGPAILAEATQSADGQTLVWTEDRAGGRVFTYDTASGASPAATVLPANAAPAAPAQLLGGRLLVPLAGGSLALFDSGSGMQTIQPFVPPLTPEALPRWSRPAILPDETGCLISDGRRAVYQVTIKNQPQRHLDGTAEVPTEPPVVSSLVAAGGAIWGWTRSDAADAIAQFDPQTLSVAQLPLQGRVRSGPFAIGGLMLVEAEPEGLMCLEAGPKIRWQQPLVHGPLAGAPLALADGDLLVIYQAGVVSRVSAESGDELATTRVDQPLGAPARVLGTSVFLSGSDGVLHRAAVPMRP